MSRTKAFKQHMGTQHSCTVGSHFGMGCKGTPEDRGMCSERQSCKKDLRSEGQRIRENTGEERAEGREKEELV